MAGSPSPQPAGQPPPAAPHNTFLDLKKTTSSAGQAVDRSLGGALKYGHDHPFEAFMGVLGAPQRGLQALETGADVGHAFMHPEDSAKLTAGVKGKIGLSGLESGALAGNDLGHKFARGVLDTGLDIVNDPLTFLPVGKIARLAGKAVPGLAKGAEALGDAAKGSGVGKLLDPEAPLAGLTTHGRAQFQSIMNLAKERSSALKRTEDKVVVKHADAIRNGELPDEVRGLFRDKANIPEAKKGLRPQEIVEALNADRAPLAPAMAEAALKKAGFFESPGGYRARQSFPGDKSKLFDVSPDKIADVQESLKGVIHPAAPSDNPIIKFGQAATRLGNKAFLANPVPHTGNLANLAYNKYGLPTLAKGVGNAFRVATGTVGDKGHLAENIAELGEHGTNSQYHNIFDELGLTKIAGISGTEGAAKVANKALIPMARAANFAQNKILNPFETGLRSAALDAEKKGGTQGVEAARNIHQAFGTDPANKLSKAAYDVGAPFAKFHVQTSVGSGIRTLLENPARITNLVKAKLDMNKQVNPGNSPQFSTSIPGLNIARAATDPEHYFPSLLGPLYTLANGYSTLSMIQKGKVSEALTQALGRYIPESEAGEVLWNLVTNEPGKAGEAATSDLLPTLTGGYYQKAKP